MTDLPSTRSSAAAAFAGALALFGCGDASPDDDDDDSAGADGSVASDATDRADARDPTDAGEPPQTASDDFERSSLGTNWAVVFPSPPNDSQVQIIDDSDLGVVPGPQGFFLVNWRGSVFAPDQFCEATIPVDAAPDWARMVYVRWRASDRARYGFAYNNDPTQEDFGNWIFKYDGVPSSETRVFAKTPADPVPGPGDTLRVEVDGYTLRGYLNGTLVLTATDTDPTRIADGETGLAARWATGNQPTDVTSKVWESWAGGSL